MRFYDCHIRLGGSTTSEVPKLGITASEIIVLRHVHGSDAVVRIEPKEDRAVNQFELRDQLRAQYERSEHQAGMIVTLLGPDHMNNLLDALDPEQEALYREEVAAKEREEAEKKVALEAEIDRRVKEQLAEHDIARKDAEMQKVINEDDPIVLNPAQIVARDEKRAAALKGKQDAARVDKAEAVQATA